MRSPPIASAGLKSGPHARFAQDAKTQSFQLFQISPLTNLSVFLSVFASLRETRFHPRLSLSSFQYTRRLKSARIRTTFDAEKS